MKAKHLALALAAIGLVATDARATETLNGIVQMTITEARAITEPPVAAGVYPPQGRYTWYLTRRLQVSAETYLDGAAEINGATTIGNSVVLGDATHDATIKQHLIGGSATPTISSGACGTGTSYTIVGTDTGFTVTIGSGSPATCAIGFFHAYAFDPVCTVTAQSASKLPAYTHSASGVVIGGGLTTGAVFDVICVGRPS